MRFSVSGVQKHHKKLETKIYVENVCRFIRKYVSCIFECFSAWGVQKKQKAFLKNISQKSHPKKDAHLRAAWAFFFLFQRAVRLTAQNGHPHQLCLEAHFHFTCNWGTWFYVSWIAG
jgi:hypothetical protein